MCKNAITVEANATLNTFEIKKGSQLITARKSEQARRQFGDCSGNNYKIR